MQKIGALAAGRRDALAAIDETGARKRNSNRTKQGGCIGNGTIFHTIAPALKERPRPISPQQVGRLYAVVAAICHSKAWVFGAHAVETKGGTNQIIEIRTVDLLLHSSCHLCWEEWSVADGPNQINYCLVRPAGLLGTEPTWIYKPRTKLTVKS